MRLLYKLIIMCAFIYCHIEVIQCEDLLELSCFSGAHCLIYQLPGVNTTCIDNHCQCSDVNGTQIKCKPLIPKQNNVIGGHCPCKQPHAECDEMENICYCEKNYISSNDKRRCIPATRKFNDKCELDVQCQAFDNFAECNAQKRVCLCKDNFIVHNGNCVTPLANDINCVVDGYCGSKDLESICAAVGLCICRPGFVSANGTEECLTASDYQESCYEDTQCQWILGPGSLCYQGFCKCHDNYFVTKITQENGLVANKYFCTRKIEEGQYCRVNENCQEKHINQTIESTMFCLHSECRHNNANNLLLNTKMWSVSVTFVFTLSIWFGK